MHFKTTSVILWYKNINYVEQKLFVILMLEIFFNTYYFTLNVEEQQILKSLNQ